MMQKFIRIVRFGILLPILAAFLVAPLVHADNNPTFNNKSGGGEEDFLTGRNITRPDHSFIDPVSANASDEVDVRIYYHNAVIDTTATNTKVKLSIPTDLANQHVINGSIGADNAPTVTGSIVDGQEVGPHGLTINSDGPTNLEFVPGSVRWFPNGIDYSNNANAVALPNGQNGDGIVTASGINIGNINGCWQFLGNILVKVKVKGTSISKATLQISKDVRRGSTSDDFIQRVSANPGNQLEYRLTIRNLDGQVSAKDLTVKDTLPAGEGYVGPTILHLSNGATSTLPDGIVLGNGIVVVSELKPLETIQITFKVITDNTIKDGVCLTNSVTTSSITAKDLVTATASACFIVPTPSPTPKPTPTATPVPTPFPTPKPTPTPTLPKTGPELDYLFVSGAGGLGLTSLRYWKLKKEVKKQARKIHVL